jgi:hypothetical protein
VIKKCKHLKQILISVGLLLMLNTMSACSDGIFQRNENKINILQGQDTTEKLSNSSNLNADVNTDTSATAEIDSSIITSKSDDIKEMTDNEQRNTYTINHKKDNSTYVVIATRDKEHHYTIQLFDRESNILKTIELDRWFGMQNFKM